MHIETENDIARHIDNDDGRIPLIIDIDKNGNGGINKCLTCGYENGVGIKVHLSREHREIKKPYNLRCP